MKSLKALSPYLLLAAAILVILTGCAKVQPKRIPPPPRAAIRAVEKIAEQRLSAPTTPAATPRTPQEIHLAEDLLAMRVEEMAPARKELWWLKVLGWVRKWDATLGWPRQDEAWVMATLIVESDLNPKLKEKTGEYGLGQAMPWSQRHYGKKLHLRKGEFKKYPELQVAIAVAELIDRRNRGRGLKWTLRSYNGKGPKSWKHLRRVQQVHRALMGSRKGGK